MPDLYPNDAEITPIENFSTDELFCVAMDTLMTVHFDMMLHNGFDATKYEDGTLIALMHSELSEALEAIRNGNPKSEHIPEFSQEEEEYADIIIRVMHVCKTKNYRLPQAIIAKMQFNKSRPYRHGKLF